MMNKFSLLLLSAFLVWGETAVITGGGDSPKELLQSAETPTGEKGNRTETNVWSSRSCPSGWSRYRSRCFKFISTNRNWAESERGCVSLGGNLASVHSRGEYNFIQDLIYDRTTRTWVGGSDAVREGHWFWSDGSELNYHFWCPGEPSDSFGTEDCMEINFGGSRCWNDARCGKRNPSVCSRNL